MTYARDVASMASCACGPCASLHSRGFSLRHRPTPRPTVPRRCPAARAGSGQRLPSPDLRRPTPSWSQPSPCRVIEASGVSTGIACALRRSPSLPPPADPTGAPRRRTRASLPAQARVRLSRALPLPRFGRRRGSASPAPSSVSHGPPNDGRRDRGVPTQKGSLPDEHRSPQLDRQPPHHAQGAPRPTRQVTPAAARPR